MNHIITVDAIPARQIFVIEIVTTRDRGQGVAALDGIGAPIPSAFRAIGIGRAAHQQYQARQQRERSQRDGSHVFSYQLRPFNNGTKLTKPSVSL